MRRGKRAISQYQKRDIEALEPLQQARDAMGEKDKVATVKVRPVLRECRGCALRSGGVCALCCTLVRDEADKVWVSLRAVNGNGWETVRADELTEAPRVLLTE